MKSVAYVTTTFPTLASFIENEVHRLRQRGVDVRVFTLRGVGTRYQPEHQSLVGITRAMGNPLSPAAWAAIGYWMSRRPDVLGPELMKVLWASRNSLYGMVGHLGYLPAAARIACAIEDEGLERVHGAWAHFPGTVAYLAARLTDRPFTLAGHAGSDLYRTQAFLAEKVRAAEFVTACVRGNAEMLRALAGAEGRVEWIYHGVNLGRFDGNGRVRDPEPLLLTVGRLAQTKGYETAIRALGELKQRGFTPRLMMVGDGPERGRLTRLARRLGVDEQVTMLGAVTHEELLPLYRRAWVLVSPSVVLPNGRRDGIPNVLVEAMAMGVPCVGTRAAGLEEIIVPGETGSLCGQSDAPGLADCIEDLLRHPSEVDRMGHQARHHVSKEFDTERNFERLLALFNGNRAEADRGAAVRLG